jgi:GlpG protein
MWMARRDIPAFARILQPKVAALFWLWLVGCAIATRMGLANIGNAAHVGGIPFGVLAGAWFFGKGSRKVVRVALSLLAIGSIVTLFWSPWSAPWVGNRAYHAHVAGRYDVAISEYRRHLAMGGDRTWALGNLAEVHATKGSAREYAATLVELRAVDPAAAAEVERRVGTPVGR